jgi:hypothetical protein
MLVSVSPAARFRILHRPRHDFPPFSPSSPSRAPAYRLVESRPGLAFHRPYVQYSASVRCFYACATGRHELNII